MPQFSTRLEPRVSPWGWPDGLVHNSRISTNKFFTNKVLQVTTRVYKNALQASEALQPYFKESEGISSTNLHCGILTRFAVEDFFSCESLNARNQENLIPTSYLQGIISYVPQPRNPFFLFTSSSVHKQPISFEVLAPAFFILQGSHVQRQYQKRTTLRSKSSTLKGLLYAPDPHKRKKGTLSDQPRLSRVSSTAHLCCRGRSRSKDMTSFVTDVEMHTIWQGYIEDPAAKDFVARKVRTIAFSKARGSCHLTSNNQPIHKFGYPLVIPYPGCTA